MDKVLEIAYPVVIALAFIFMLFAMGYAPNPKQDNAKYGGGKFLVAAVICSVVAGFWPSFPIIIESIALGIGLGVTWLILLPFYWAKFAATGWEFFASFFGAFGIFSIIAGVHSLTL